jgi:hypothetical protein
MTSNGAARRSLWLITRCENGPMDVLTLNPGSDREALPIFSYEEEAEVFIQLGMPEMGWRARRATAGELVSVLYGPCAGVKMVTLDPIPAVGYELVLDLVGSGREQFLQNFVGESSFPQGRPQANVIITPELAQRVTQTRETKGERTRETALCRLVSIRDETPDEATI